MTYQEVIKELSLTLGDELGGSTCRTCTKSYCCEHQSEIGISSKEFDKIEHLVTKEQIARAEAELEKLASDTSIKCNGRSTYRCPFLAEEGGCEIYEDRFIVCASYSVVSDVKECSHALCSPGSTVDIVNPENIFQQLMLREPARMYEILPYTEEKDAADVLEEFKSRYLS